MFLFYIAMKIKKKRFKCTKSSQMFLFYKVTIGRNNAGSSADLDTQQMQL